MTFIHRKINQDILDALQRTPVVFVNGPRQAGKSTLVQKLSKTAWPATYITFDEPSLLGAAQANPEIFLKAYGKALIIDEVQMVPDLFRVLKMIVDELRLEHSKNANGHYLLTGSANILALPKLADALVGRMEIITLYPLSAVEITKGSGTFLETLFSGSFPIQKYPDDEDLVTIIHRATFPEITEQDDKTRHHWFENYIMTILQRDVRQISDIEKLGTLPNLLRVLASRAGGLINDADIARSIGQNAVTSKNYRLLLRMIFLTFEIKPWFRNIGKRLVKSPKGYLIDTALLCHLQQMSLKSISLKDPHLFGHVLENFVASELLKQCAYFGNQAELLHFRTSDDKEVDFVLQKPDGTLAGIEVKAKDNVASDDFKGLKELQSQTKEDFRCGIVLYRGKNTIPFGENLWAVPVNALWI
jgi:predicted AAA+ superfamily ATPase